MIEFKALKRVNSIFFPGSEAGETIGFTGEEWASGESGSSRYCAVWSLANGDFDFDFAEQSAPLEIAPVAALRFPAVASIERLGPERFLEMLSDEENEFKDGDPLKNAFLYLWHWLKEEDRDLTGWACGFADKMESERFALLRLFYELEFDAIARMALGRYVPLPPPQLAKQEASAVKAPDPEGLILSAFQHESRLAKAMRSFEFRAEQAEMAGIVWKALEAERHLMIEAGTGIGKSLAYLLPAAMLSSKERTPVVVSTNTINLQQQLMKSDLPAVMDALEDLKISVSLLKGRGHYFCRLRAKDAMFGTGELAQRLNALCAEAGDSLVEYAIRMAFWQQAADCNGDLDAISQPPGLTVEKQSAYQRAIDCGSATCLRSKCQFRQGCWFYQARDRAEKSHIIVMNHALLFRLFGAQTADVETLLDKINYFVLDEAHNLEDVITGQFTFELTGQGMLDFANDIQRLFDDPEMREVCAALETGGEGGSAGRTPFREEIQNAVREWVKAKREIDKWSAALLNGKRGAELSLTNPEQGDGAAAKLLEPLLELCASALSSLKAAAEPALSAATKEDSENYVSSDEFQTQAQMTISALTDFNRTLAALTVEADESVRWTKVTTSRDGITFRCYACPIEIGDIFRGFLDKQSSVVMTSATLTAGGGYSYLKSRLGLETLDEKSLQCVRLTTPFDIENQARVVIPLDVPEPVYSNMTPFIEFTASSICEIAEGFGGGTLALFNSYADLDKVAAIVAKKLPKHLTLLCQGTDGPPHVLAGKMKGGSGIVLFGTKSFWEGFDMPGDDLRAVVLTRLPFANFKEPVLKARAEAVKERGGNEFMEFSVPQAAMRFAQGFGRLIRSKTDRGCIFVMDTRVVTKRYGALFLNSLPAHTVVKGKAADVIPEAIRWYRADKSAAAGGG